MRPLRRNPNGPRKEGTGRRTAIHFLHDRVVHGFLVEGLAEMSKLRGRWGSGRRLVICAAFVAAIAGALPAAEIGTGFQERVYRDD